MRVVVDSYNTLQPLLQCFKIITGMKNKMMHLSGRETLIFSLTGDHPHDIRFLIILNLVYFYITKFIHNILLNKNKLDGQK